MDDLVERDGIHYKKFSDVPFTGEVKGLYQGKFESGKRDGPWLEYRINGQLMQKGDFKNGKKEGRWVIYYGDGTLLKDLSGVFKDGVKISD